MTHELIKTRLVYPGRAFTVRQETVRLPDNRLSKLDIVDHIGSVIILPVDQTGELLFVRQYRHPARQDLLELPAGTLEVDEAPEDCARREVREETGMAAGKLLLLGGFYLAPGYSTEYMHVYLATELRSDPLEADVDEFLSVERLSVEQAFAQAESGRLPDSKTLAALLLARSRLLQNPPVR